MSTQVCVTCITSCAGCLSDASKAATTSKQGSYDEQGGATDPSTGPAYERCPGCLALPLMCGALLCLRAVLCFASTGPGVLRQAPLTSYVLCGALLCFDSPCFVYLRHPPGVLCPGVLCLALPLACFVLLACFACFACFALLTCFLHILRAVTLVVYMRKR